MPGAGSSKAGTGDEGMEGGAGAEGLGLSGSRLSIWAIHVDTLPKTNSSPLKIGHPKRKLVFQSSIFRCYVGFREGSSIPYFQSIDSGFRMVYRSCGKIMVHPCFQ